MQVATNPEYIRSRRRLQRRATFIGLFLLGSAFVFTFAFQQLIYLSWPILIIGFVVSNVSRQAQFEAGLGVPTEERFTRALSKLSQRYWLGHYVPIGKFFVRHMLIGPEGVLVFEPRNHPRDTNYVRGKWRRKTGLFSRMFGVEPGIGNPARDLEATLELVRNDLAANGLSDVPVSGAVVFTAGNASLNLEECPVNVLTIRQLEAWAAQHRLPATGVLEEPVRRKLVELYASRLPAAVTPPSAGRGK